MPRTITRIEDIDGLQKGDLLFVGASNKSEFFWSEANREIMPFCFGGILTLSEEVKDAKKGITEKGHGFDVNGYLIAQSADQFYEQGTPRYNYYKRFLESRT